MPNTADGTVEMIRLVQVAKDVAVKARTSSMISLKAVLVNAPAELREELQPLTKMVFDPPLRRAAARRGCRSDDRSETHPAGDPPISRILNGRTCSPSLPPLSPGSTCPGPAL